MKNFGKIISDKDVITKEYLDSKGYISAITSKMVTDALGFTPFDSAAFTKASIKNALGIADWALAASKPSYNFSEIGSKPTTLSGYGITDAAKAGFRFDSIQTGDVNIIGWVEAANNWKGQGAGMLVGQQNYYTRINITGENDAPTMYLSRIYAGTAYDWVKVLTEKNIGTHAIEVINASDYPLPTDTRAFTAFVYERDNWRTAGPALAFPADGNNKGLLNIAIGNGDTQPTRLFLGGIRGGVLQKWVEVLTEETNKFVLTGPIYWGGLDFDSLTTAGTYTLAGGGNTGNPSGKNYGNVLTVVGKNDYFVSQIFIENKGQMWVRARNDSAYNNGSKWSNWRTVLDTENIGNYAIPKTGGTVTGQIYIETSAGDRFIHSKCDTAHIAFGIGAGGDNRGIFDMKDGKWWIVRNNSDYTEIVSSAMALVGNVDVTGVLKARNGITLGNVTRTSWPVEGISKDTYLMPTNSFDHSGRLEHSYAANALYAADKRFSVSGSGFSYFNASQLFDGSYEGGYCARVETGATATMTISNNGSNIIAGYPYGDIYLSFYYNNVPADVKVEVYCNYASQGIGWKTLTLKGRRGDHNDVWYYNNSYYDVTQLRITITASASIVAALTEIDWHLSRAALSNLPIVTKFGIDQTLYGHMKFANNVTMESAAGHNVKFDGYALNVNAGLYIGSGYSLRLNGEAITSWSQLRTSWGMQVSTAVSGNNSYSVDTGIIFQISTTLTSAHNINIALSANAPSQQVVIFTIGSSKPTITITKDSTTIKWENGTNPLSSLQTGKTYRIQFDGNLAMTSIF